MNKRLTACAAGVVFSVFLLHLWPLQAGAVDDGVPAIWATVSYFTWVTQTPAPLEEFSFFVNGSQLDGKKANAVKHKDSLHLRLPLVYEKDNAIEIRQLGHRIYRANVFYAPSYESAIVPDKSTYLPFHVPETEKPCQECHRLTVVSSDYVPPNVKEQVCYSCHQHKFDGVKTQHKPAAVEWRCLFCHQAEERPSQWSPDQPMRFTIEGGGENVAALCYKCHKKFAEQVEEYSFQHGPIGMGACNACHNPHASKWPKLLQNNQTTLCINCHEFKEKIYKPMIHQIIKTKGCTPCHGPHGGKYRLQMAETINDNCTRCHPAIRKQANNHPVQRHPTFIAAGPKERKDKLSCVDCHSPHASAYRNLLPEEDVMMLCTHCHPMGTK
ncbi:MAG: cytochrome c3 family protein [Desulfobulbaceae bacterium]|nr:cytochrome c3 family protein [Desulfobulbaceae bacterium]